MFLKGGPEVAYGVLEVAVRVGSIVVAPFGNVTLARRPFAVDAHVTSPPIASDQSTLQRDCHSASSLRNPASNDLTPSNAIGCRRKCSESRSESQHWTALELGSSTIPVFEE